MRYDDMMGLDAYGGGGLGAWMDAQMLKEHLMAGAVGGAGILVTSSLLARWTQPTTGMFSATPPAGTAPADWNGSMNFRRAKGVIATIVGILGGRAIYDRNRDAAMAFVGGVAGMGFADLIASWVPESVDATSGVHTQYVKANLSGGGYLSGADLRALEMAVSTPMNSWRPSYDMAGTVAQARGLAAPVVTDTVLGNAMGYQPWNS